MGSQAKKWIVRDGKGHIFGPFDHAKLKELLGRGLLTGDEEAAEYPAGDWLPMSSHGDLYDLVLGTLMDAEQAAASGSSSSGGSGAPKIPQPTASRSGSKGITGSTTGRLSREDIDDELDPDKTPPPGAPIQTESAPPSGTASRPFGHPLPVPGQSAGAGDTARQGSRSVPPLTPPAQRVPPTRASTGTSAAHGLAAWLERLKRPKTSRSLKGSKRNFSNLIPLILVFAALALFYFGGSLRDHMQSRKTISLILPRPKGGNDPAASAKLMKEGWSRFYRDTFSDYLKAEELFAQAVEAAPQNAEALAMLAFTDVQLWPFAKQDSHDESTLSTILEMAAAADRAGDKRAVAAVSVDYALGREQSARSLAESALVTQPNEGRLYALRGRIAFDASDCKLASAYYDRAAGVLKYWVHPFYMLGVCAAKSGSAPQAQQYLAAALRMNPNHTGARMELGILEARAGQTDRAKKDLTAALESGDQLPPLAEARGRLQLGLILYGAGDISAAKRQGKIALYLNPSDPDVRDFLTRLGEKVGEAAGSDDRQDMILGDQYMRSGNYLGAQAHYKAAFVRNPHNARAAMKAAEALWKMHQSVGAIDYLNKSIAADPKFIESFVLLADYKSQRYDFTGAVTALEAAVKINPKSFEVFAAYAEVLLRKGDSAAADAYAQRALKLYDGDVKANVVMSRVKLAEKDAAGALQYARHAVELDRTNTEAQVNYARALANYEGVKSAIEYLKDLINTFPTMVDYRLGLAEILIADEQFSSTKQLLDQVISTSADMKEAHMLLGDCDFATNELNEALDHYLTAARLDPSDAAPLFRAGELYLKAGRPDDARKQFEFVLRVNPLFPRVHYNLARAAQAMGVPEKAISELEEEKSLNPKLAEPYEYEGDIFLITRRFAQAGAQYQKAIELRPPTTANLYVKLARAYRLQGGYDQALSMLRQAQAIESGNSEIYKEYGWLYATKGQPEFAVEAFEKYLRLEPNSPDKEAISAKINELK